MLARLLLLLPRPIYPSLYIAAGVLVENIQLGRFKHPL